MEGAIAKELQASGPRAKAVREGEGPEACGDAADSRAYVARVAVPEGLGRGRCKSRGQPPAGLKVAARLLGDNDSGAIESMQKHRIMLRSGDVSREENELPGGRTRTGVGGLPREGGPAARRQEKGPPAEGPTDLRPKGQEAGGEGGGSQPGPRAAGPTAPTGTSGRGPWGTRREGSGCR